MQNEQVISYKEATGVIQYNMTNDYMFRYILQKNQKVLKGLICAVLHLEPEQIKKVEITNPINLNEDIKDKEFVLDIDVMLNDNTKIGLEMQVENKHNWTERSLSYLCRSYDQLYRGQEYEEKRGKYIKRCSWCRNGIRRCASLCGNRITICIRVFFNLSICP